MHNNLTHLSSLIKDTCNIISVDSKRWKILDERWFTEKMLFDNNVSLDFTLFDEIVTTVSISEGIKEVYKISAATLDTIPPSVFFENDINYLSCLFKHADGYTVPCSYIINETEDLIITVQNNFYKIITRFSDNRQNKSGIGYDAFLSDYIAIG